MEEWTGTSYIFYLPDWKVKAEHDKKGIAEFFGYKDPEKQVKLIQLDESLKTDANGNFVDPLDIFITMWNDLDDSMGIDMVTLMVHGCPTHLNTEHTWMTNSKGDKEQITFIQNLYSFNSETAPKNYSTINDKNISMLLLMTCESSLYGRHFVKDGDENTSIARKFGETYGIGKVVASNAMTFLEDPYNDKRHFYVVVGGSFVLYTKGVTGIKAEYCLRASYSINSILEEVFSH